MRWYLRIHTAGQLMQPDTEFRYQKPKANHSDTRPDPRQKRSLIGEIFGRPLPLVYRRMFFRVLHPAHLRDNRLHQFMYECGELINAERRAITVFADPGDPRCLPQCARSSAG